MSREDDLRRQADAARRAHDREGEDYFNPRYRQAKADRKRKEQFDQAQSRRWNQNTGGGFSGGHQGGGGVGSILGFIGSFFIGLILVSIFNKVKDFVSTTVGIIIEVVETVLIIGMIALFIWGFIKWYRPIIRPTAIFIWQKIIVPVTVYSITKVIIPFIKWVYTRCLKPFTIWLYDLIANLFNKKNHKAKVYHNYQHYREDK